MAKYKNAHHLLVIMVLAAWLHAGNSIFFLPENFIFGVKES